MVDWSGVPRDWFQEQLAHFLFSPRGAKYKLNFQFQGDLQCGQPAPKYAQSLSSQSYSTIKLSAQHLYRNGVLKILSMPSLADNSSFILGAHTELTATDLKKLILSSVPPPESTVLIVSFLGPSVMSHDYDICHFLAMLRSILILCLCCPGFVVAC